MPTVFGGIIARPAGLSALKSLLIIQPVSPRNAWTPGYHPARLPNSPTPQLYTFIRLRLKMAASCAVAGKKGLRMMAQPTAANFVKRWPSRASGCRQGMVFAFLRGFCSYKSWSISR